MRALFLALFLAVMPMKASAHRYDSLFSEYSGDIDWRYLKAQAMAESAMNPRAKSHVGAQGLTQFMPETWLEIMGEDPEASPHNPEDSIKAQAIYMKRLVRMFDGDLRKATAAYNCGPGRVARAVAKHGDEWMEALPAETRVYVPRIESYYEQYKRGTA